MCVMISGGIWTQGDHKPACMHGQSMVNDILVGCLELDTLQVAHVDLAVLPVLPLNAELE